MLTATLALALMIAPDDPKPAPAEVAARKSLDGYWTVVSCRVQNKETGVRDRDDAMEFKDGKAIIIWKNKPAPKPLNVTIDPRPNPATIDLKGPDGAVFKGIYKREGDRLWICYNSGARPKTFDADAAKVPPFNVLFELKKPAP